MECIVFLILVLRNFFKFRQVYYLEYQVHFVDILLNSFLACFVLLSILIAHIDLAYTYNSVYLIFFISLLFAMGMSYIHNFFRVSALEKFFANFVQLREDLDFSVNTIIDFLCSKNKRDRVRIKGLIQLIISQSGCEAAKNRQRDKTEKYQRYFRESESKSILFDQIDSDSRIRSDSAIASAVESKYMIDSTLNETAKTQNSLIKLKSKQSNNRKHESLKSGSEYKMEVEEFKEQTQQHPFFCDFNSGQNSHILDPSQINLNDQTQDFNNKTVDYLVQNQSQNQTFGIPQTGLDQFENDQSQAINNFENLDMYESKDLDVVTLLDSQSVYHSKKDVYLILEVIDLFLHNMKQNQTNSSIYLRVLLLKIRLIYLSQKQERLLYLMYLISCLDSLKPNFRVKVIKHIYQRKFQNVFQNKVQEKSTRVTPTALVFYEHQREFFEQSVFETTEMMTQWLCDLKLQGTTANEINRRFIKAKEIVQMTIDLNTRFKKIVNLQAQQMDLVIMYFHFLDQVVHQENEAKDVYKIMVDLSNSDKMNKRFEISQGEARHQGSGFILVSGNQNNLGCILKLNNTVCNYLQYFKNDLINRKIEHIMPFSIAQYHEQVIANYVLISSSVSSKNKRQQNKINKDQTNNDQQNMGEQDRDSLSKSKETSRHQKWHLNQKNQLLTFKTKQNTIVPLVCNFDIYFDLNYGIQFLCLIQQPSIIDFEDQKVNKNDVYLFQTNGYAMIEGVSQNMMKRFGITQQRAFEERLYISQISESLTDLNEVRFENGSPEFLDLRILQTIQNEESKFQMEKYQQKISVKTQKFKISLLSNLDDANKAISAGDTNKISGQYTSFQLLMPNEFQQICYVKREVLPYSWANAVRNKSANIENEQIVMDERRAGVVYYLVFYDGMTQQMRESANQYYELKFKDEKNSVHTQIGATSLNLNFRQKSLNDDQNMKTSAADDYDSSKSEGQFTFASTSSSAMSSQKDKISELKNESFLGQMPLFVSFFQKVFIFYFILFFVASTVILVVVLQSVQNYYEIIDNVQAVKQFFSDTTAVLITFRAYMNIANNLQDHNSTIVGDKFDYIQKQLEHYNELMRLENNNLRQRVDKSAISKIMTLYKSEIVPIYELTQKAEIKTRNMSLDQAVSVFITKIQSLIDGIDGNDVFSKQNPLQCDCGLSRSMITNKRSKSLTFNYVERDSFFIIENGDYFIVQFIYDIGEAFQNYSDDQVTVFKNQILILVICCMSLAFACSIAFLPYYLKMRRNLNLNIFLIEKMNLTSIQEVLANISSFTKMLNSQKGKYGGGYQSEVNHTVGIRGESQQDSQQQQHQNDPGQRIQSTMQSQKRRDLNKKLAIKNQKQIHKKGSIYSGDSTNDIFTKSKSHKFKKDIPHEDKPISESLKTKERAPTSTTFQTHKTTENMVFKTNGLDLIEEYKEIDLSKMREEESSSDEEVNQELDHKIQQKMKKIKHNDNNDKQGNSVDEKDNLDDGSDVSYYSENSEVLRDKQKSIKEMYARQKIRVIAVSFITSMILAVFFIIAYVLSARAFDQAQDSIQRFSVFYNIQPYVVTFIQLSREQYDKNNSDYFDFNGMKELEEIYKSTLAVNDDIRELKQNYPVTLEQAQGYLKQLDSSDFCSIAIPQIKSSHDLSVQDCLTVGDGVFKNGFSYAISTMLSFFYMQQIQFDKMEPAKRTQAWLNQMLNDKKSNDYILIYLKYITFCYELIQDAVTKSFSTYFDNRAKEIIALYAVFLVVLIIIILVLLYILMNKLKKEIYLARKTIQLIPHKELMKNENYEIASRIKY